ncbi:MAG: anti-sigma factor [Leptolyngbya sp. SIOISBB]|nr:anti-sigma factor [Leptolyngbya sp. SIOISBB]
MFPKPQPISNTFLAGYVLNNLTPEEVAQVEQLLLQHPTLAIEAQQLQSTLAVLSLSLPDTQPSPQLETRLLQAAQADASPIKLRRRVWRSLGPWVAVGSAAAIMVGLSLEVVQLRRQLGVAQADRQSLQTELDTVQATLAQLRQTELPQTQHELSRYQAAVSLLQQPDSRYFTMTGTAPEMPSTGSLVIAPEVASSILVMRGVAALPEDKVYRLWAVVDGQKIACGDFTPNANGDVFVQLPVGQWGNTAEVSITVEPAQELAEPVGEMVIVGS